MLRESLEAEWQLRPLDLKLQDQYGSAMDHGVGDFQAIVTLLNKLQLKITQEIVKSIIPVGST